MRIRLLAALGFCGVAGLFAWQFAQAQAPTAVSALSPDHQAIVEASKAFTQAFQKGDAKALAAHWTEQGEYSDDRGVELRGRAALEKAFAAVLKAAPKGPVDVQIESIRFPSKDTAIEEGILRRGSDGPELPSSTFYRVWHVREAGQWRVAAAREWGAGRDRMEDLAWLVGVWKGVAKEKEMTLTFSWDKTKPFMTGQFATKAKDKVVASGQIKIAFDAGKNLIRSWSFDDDGGHGQAMWVRDGNRWVMDSRGALTDGTSTAALNILTRLGPNEILWRSIDRVIGGAAAPDTLPIKLIRSVPQP
ncbi:MAG: SgcJ/EcaC family oxidoreductase [Planctomycetota bacterium]